MMETKYWPANDTQTGLQEAAAALAAGGVVAFPTETVYGLGADARNSAAVSRIFQAKGRPSDNPLIVHLASSAALNSLVHSLNVIERQLIEAFWPGPLTLVLPVKPDALSPLVTAGLDTVAVRVPAHPVARRLIAEADCPIAAPSANLSGRPSPTLATHVTDDLDGLIEGVVDGGATGVGVESTVVRVLDDTIHILRPGGITREQLRAAVGDGVRIASEETAADMTTVPLGDDRAGDGDDIVEAPRSPGVKYRHYAPKGSMLLITGEEPMRVVAAVREAAAAARAAGAERVGIVTCEEHAGHYEQAADEVLVCGSQAAPALAAQQLYAVLRRCDQLKLDAIVAEGFSEAGIGEALMNRMRKAASGRERKV